MKSIFPIIETSYSLQKKKPGYKTKLFEIMEK